MFFEKRMSNFFVNAHPRPKRLDDQHIRCHRKKNSASIQIVAGKKIIQMSQVKASDKNFSIKKDNKNK